MKVSKIIIKDYLQFKDIEIDLTYPKDHPTKAGLPLEKICIIGQSGTGKTTLLRLIKYFITRNKLIGKNVEISNIDEESVKMDLLFQDYKFTRFSNSDGGFSVSHFTKKGTSLAIDKLFEIRDTYLETLKPYLVNFPSELIFENNIVDAKIEMEEAPKKETSKKEKLLSQIAPESVVDFAFDDASKTWDLVLWEIKEYQAKLLEWGNKLASLATNKNHNPKDVVKQNSEYSAWVSENPNPLELLAEECLDPILKRFGLKVKRDMDYQTILNLGNILLQTTDGIDVHRNFWSTGTKQIYSRATPLYELSPKNAIILMDEPETSLYPDIQKIIIDYYTSFTKNCQFFFATHSPIIASCFDPWEIIELKFDKKNEFVFCEKNYKGERLIENFEFYPKYLRWDNILMKVFELGEDGNNDREDKLMELAQIKRKINSLKKSNPNIKTPAYKKLLKEYEFKSKQTGWDEKN